MEYKVLKCEDYTEHLDFSFYINKCEDESGNIVYRLLARKKGSKIECVLFENAIFIAFAQINEEIKSFLMREIKIILDNKLLNLKLNIRYGIAKYNDYFEVVDFHGNNSYIAHLGDFDNNYDAMTDNIINYLEDLALNERLNTK